MGLALEVLPHSVPAQLSSLISHLHVTCCASLSFLPTAPHIAGSSRTGMFSSSGSHLSLPYTSIPAQHRCSLQEATLVPPSLPPSPGKEASSWMSETGNTEGSFRGTENSLGWLMHRMQVRPGEGMQREGLKRWPGFGFGKNPECSTLEICQHQGISGLRGVTWSSLGLRKPTRVELCSQTHLQNFWRSALRCSRIWVL